MSPYPLPVGVMFRAANDYAARGGYAGAYPTFKNAPSGSSGVAAYGLVVIRPGFATWRDVPAAQLGSPGSDDFPERFRQTNDYSVQTGFFGGFPNMHEANYGTGIVYGTILLHKGTADWRDVPASTLGFAADVRTRFRHVHEYAVAQGYVGGFPNFHEADYGSGPVYGVLFLKREACEWRYVPRPTLFPPAQEDVRYAPSTMEQAMFWPSPPGPPFVFPEVTLDVGRANSNFFVFASSTVKLRLSRQVDRVDCFLAATPYGASITHATGTCSGCDKLDVTATIGGFNVPSLNYQVYAGTIIVDGVGRTFAGRSTQYLSPVPSGRPPIQG